MGDQPEDDSVRRPASALTADRVIPASAGLDTRLPAPVAKRLERLVGDPPIETMADWVRTVRAFTGGGGIDIADLCHAEDSTPHYAVVGDTRYDFRCFYDAVILAALVDAPVQIRTESPTGTVIEAAAVGTTELTVDPPSAVFSFGVAEDVTPPPGSPTPADVYGAVCPYVKAFNTPAAYHDWRATVAAETVAMPLDGATALAAALVD